MNIFNLLLFIFKMCSAFIWHFAAILTLLSVAQEPQSIFSSNLAAYNKMCVFWKLICFLLLIRQTLTVVLVSAVDLDVHLKWKSWTMLNEKWFTYHGHSDAQSVAFLVVCKRSKSRDRQGMCWDTVFSCELVVALMEMADLVGKGMK